MKILDPMINSIVREYFSLDLIDLNLVENGKLLEEFLTTEYTFDYGLVSTRSNSLIPTARLPKSIQYLVTLDSDKEIGLNYTVDSKVVPQFEYNDFTYLKDNKSKFAILFKLYQNREATNRDLLRIVYEDLMKSKISGYWYLPILLIIMKFEISRTYSK